MHTSRFAMRSMLPAALLTALAASPGRAEDDVAVDDKPPAQAQVLPFQGEIRGGNVIIMPGLRLQVLGGGAAQANPFEAKAIAPKRRQPYLGVVVGPVSAAVRAQLDLPEGVGVSVEAVAADSPAEKAGLGRFDVIRMFKDQLIVSDEQLTTLVKAAGTGAKVPLKVLRGGREREVEAVLDEHEVLADGAKPLGLGELTLQWGCGGPDLDPEELAAIERQLQQGALQQFNARGGVFAPVGGRTMTQSQVVAGGLSQSSKTVSDERGTVEINRSGDKQTVTVKDPTGKEVHAGPLDTAEDFAKVPEAYREWVRELAPREAELVSDK